MRKLLFFHLYTDCTAELVTMNNIKFEIILSISPKDN